jgi:hypothetical protein
MFHSRRELEPSWRSDSSDKPIRVDCARQGQVPPFQDGSLTCFEQDCIGVCNFCHDRNYRLNSSRCQVPHLSFRHLAPGHLSMRADANVPPASGSRCTAAKALIEQTVLRAIGFALVPEAGKLQMIR